MKTDLKMMMGLPCFAPFWNGADEGGSGAGGPDGAAGDQGDGGKSTVLTSGGDGATGGKPDASGDADGKPDGADAQQGKDGDGDKDGGGDEAPAEFSIDVPEGMETFADDFKNYSSDAQSWLTDNPKASAADALKWAASRQAEAVQQQIQQGAESWQNQVSGWEKEARADPEIGGDKFDENAAIALKAVQTFGEPALNDLLNETGLGAHPAMIRFAYKAGKALAESPVMTTQGGDAKKSFGNAMYGGKK